ncbi:hypothetical protein FML39_25915 [Klebsiella variicola]|uniref:hypothetical protein n=1 Tax=Klebsiella variicola TaxID=244366 RepID=UPI0018A91175|nr:hypothetical protein [Klebsiella variicola]MBF8480022.1 hypothetical protein [Klebsiella variicola]HBZ7265972.1 hypothetical protein [Klebsiella variicola subsp. variicola]
MACALFLSFTLRVGSVGDVVSGLLSFSTCEVMAFSANQEFALSFGVRVGKRDGAVGLFWPGLVWSFFPGILFRVLEEWRSEKLAFSRRFLVVVEICFMGSVAWGNEVGLFGSLAGRGGYCLGVG